MRSVNILGACVVLLLSVWSPCATAQTGTEFEPIRFMGSMGIDLRPHDGALRPPVGTSNYQVVRVNRTHPEWAEDCGWTYNHAPALAYWNDTFYLEYLSNPVDEHIPPGQTLVATSKDGRHWCKPAVVFPPYEAPEGVRLIDGALGYMMHQRMGFYTAPNGRLLVLAFYGHAEDPFGPGGIGRVVREAYPDGNYGPIYFIRYSSHTKWNETNTSYPFYTTSADTGFIEACQALLADPLATLQWHDEDQGLDGFYTATPGGSALSYFHRKDGTVVGLWKRSMCALSADGGRTFSKPVKAPTFIMAGGKFWGQATDDGRYAAVHNPVEYDEHRYPLVLSTSDDGIYFDDLLVVHGEVPPRRFYGRWKDFGPQYVRGIAEGNGNPPGDDLWLAYSVNKEDLWVSRVPLPVTSVASGPVSDNFDGMAAGGHVENWNVYSPVWAPVEVAEFPDKENKSLELRDRDPYDYAKAVRIIEETAQGKTAFRVFPRQNTEGQLDIDWGDRYGHRAIRLRFAPDGKLKVSSGARWIIVKDYTPEQWYSVGVDFQAGPGGLFALSIDGEAVLQDMRLAEDVRSIERLVFRTGPHRIEPLRQTPNQEPCEPLPHCDLPDPEAVFYVDDVVAESTS